MNYENDKNDDKYSINLSKEILNSIEAPKDLGLLKCIQCGMCTSLCPAAAHTDYNPRDLIAKILNNDESIIEDDKIWNCFYCYTCQSVCPVKNSACLANQVIRQIAIDRGIAKEKIKPFVTYGETFLDIGIGGMPKSFFMDLNKDIDGWLDLKTDLDKIREELSLGPVKMPKKSIEEVNLLLKKAKFHKRMEKMKSE
ncbi:heterodisulfide reductase, subunit C [Methanobrevibacter arboriphilus JCM 13429 = DSM 1125]|jgi:heterodisulfide reductase subunit C|uniref:Heterodisulfide reductase, subunit C n=2 Tax=Methanobrevibacter arboriphilus TaxID=39441 RepID=A0A1V6N1M9_METAZ|nr:ferredoxin:CoB-CoM heterodisulfide reductase subunit HdrC [Methanobrevibacter arboriphilus]OQD58416.1 heterodisulfide reductase, subunit C [Methanobrevibacter arboriphilus JCM 13429 = DSM 1125]BBL61133.1 hypothetical protein MarbSA_01730 [Methanobrevibacter arboriphilus]GLI12272.1 hypothetical protein MARBORIA2_13620 [Methanobrevibacter arboriphilus]